jgi:peptidoglycan hydrolase-like protein with peptidoglycan-binding domain
MSRARVRAAVLTGVAVAAIAAAAAATLGLGGRGEGEEPRPPRTGPAATTVVTRQDLVETRTLAGKLNYGGAIPLSATATGTVTWLPQPGTTVRRGEELLRADEKPVALLYGPLPMFRDLSEGAKGTDVRQLERNLSALGYGGFTVDDDFSAATTAAVKRWQKDLELPETGAVERWRVVYAPGPVRIAQQLVRVGASATGDVLSYTGNTRIVTITADADEAGWARKGVRVTVTLPGGATVAGQISGVTAASTEQAADEQPGPDTGGRTVVTVAIADQKALGKLDAGAVDVRYTAKERKDVLTVPVAALLALAEGGYGLEFVDPATRGSHIVRATAGMFADGRVEVSGAGVTAGTTVGMPGSALGRVGG